MKPHPARISTYIVLIFLLTISIPAKAQDGYSEVLEKEMGTGPFAINTSKENVHQYLFEKICYGSSSGSLYKADPVRSGLETYFGLKVDSIIVEFSIYRESEGAEVENIAGITLFLQPAKDKEEENDFINSLAGHYGDPGRFWDMSVDPPVTLRWDWWCESCLLNIRTGVNDLTGKKEPYYRASYQIAYGG